MPHFIKVETERERQLLENRDRIWCLALLAGGQVTIDVTHRVLQKYHELMANEEATLNALDNFVDARRLYETDERKPG